jgi:IclR family acetate operon transcriptional repressor
MTDDTKAQPIKVLANATELIEALAKEGTLSPADIAERIGVPRSSAYRLVDGLTAISLVEVLPDGRARLSARWLQLADDARAGLTEWRDAPPVLERLVSRTGQTAFLSVLSDDAAACVDWRQGRGVDVLATKPGHSLPLNAGASGRVMLAFSADSEELLARGAFRSLTPTTLVTLEQLNDDIATTRQQGYAFSDGDVAVGIAGIAVPVLDARGALAGTVSIAGLADSVRERREELATALIEEVGVLQGVTRQ